MDFWVIEQNGLNDTKNNQTKKFAAIYSGLMSENNLIRVGNWIKHLFRIKCKLAKIKQNY